MFPQLQIGELQEHGRVLHRDRHPLIRNLLPEEDEGGAHCKSPRGTGRGMVHGGGDR